MARQPYRSGSLYQRSSDGRWCGTLEAGYTATGGRRRITVTGKTQAEVKRRLRDKRLEIERAGSPAVGRALTVKAWAEEWLTITERTLRPKTWATNRGQVNKWIVASIGHRRLSELTVADVRRVDQAQRKEGKAPSSVQRTRAVLLKMLRDAAAEGHHVAPVVLALRGLDQAKIRKQATGRRQALDLAHAGDIFAVLTDRADRSRYLIPFLQGLRQGETLGLTWDAVDLDAGTLAVSWQLQALPYVDRKNKALGFRVPDDYEARHLEGAFHLVRPKTDAGERIIPLIPEAVAALRAWREVAPPNRHGLVWSRPDGRPVDRGDDLRAWYDLQDAAGVKHPSGRHYYLHEIRNTTATVLLELGVDEFVVTAIMGHTSIDTSRLYMTARAETLRAALEQVGKRMLLSGEGS